MKSWKKRWLEELDEKIPALSEEVRDAEIPAQAAAVRQVKFSSRKGFFAALSAAVCAVIVALAVVFANPFGGPVVASAEVVTVEINPRAAFVVEGGEITSVVSLNGDADVLLNEERRAEIEGKPADEGVTIFVDYAAQLGYLSLSDETALRLSTAKEEGCSTQVCDALSGYFREKGAYIAVAVDILTKAGLEERIGERIDGATEKSYSLRAATDKTAEELTALYRETVPLEGLKPSVENMLNENIDRIEENIADLQELDELNRQIRRHEGNPHRFLFDYWDFQWIEKGEDEDFLSLLSEMDKKLAEYAEKYEKLGSRYEMNEALSLPLDTVLDTVKAWLVDFTMEIFLEECETLVALLKNVGLEVKELLDACKAPTNLKEYTQKVTSYFDGKFAELLEKGKEVYEETRAAISEFDYHKYTEEIAGEYGSLSAYYESLQK